MRHLERAEMLLKDGKATEAQAAATIAMVEVLEDLAEMIERMSNPVMVISADGLDHDEKVRMATQFAEGQVVHPTGEASEVVNIKMGGSRIERIEVTDGDADDTRDPETSSDITEDDEEGPEGTEGPEAS